MFTNQTAGFVMGSFQAPSDRTHKPTSLIQDKINTKIDLGLPCDGQRFQVEGISFQVSVPGGRIVQELKTVECLHRFREHKPGQMAFLPPEKPAIKWGSTSPVTTRKSASI